jgi:hypothetical protein
LPPELLEQVERVVERLQETKKPPRWRAIVRWLNERGVKDMTVHRLAKHFERGHHERP